MNTILAFYIMEEGERGREKVQASAVRCQYRLISFVSCPEGYSSFYFPHAPINTSDLDVSGEGRGNVEHKTLLCLLAIAHIGAAYKNQEGSLASLFQRCSTSDVRTMNIRNGNSISAAVPVQHLDPMESEEWSAKFTPFLISLISLHSFSIVFLLPT
jgi:hypothetical protein